MEKNKLSSVLVKGRLWFDKTGGNTYYNTELWINGKYLGQTGLQYGYGSEWERGGVELFNQIFGTGYKYFSELEQLGVTVYYVNFYVERKREMNGETRILLERVENLAVPNHG